MIDGEFYFVDVERWRDNEPNEWVFAYEENQDYVTNHYCAVRIDQVHDSICSIYDTGRVCEESSILDLRPATQEDINRFWDYLDRWNYRYCLNTKKLRHVGRG
jgi:hypothetical protein